MNKYRECIRCVMDTSDPDIHFDEFGVCHHCRRYDTLLASRVSSRENQSAELQKIVSKIRQAGRGSEYDCLIGVSGGVDSTYVAYLVKSLGLRPLAIHLDNGWNSELAVKNIEELLNRLDIDLLTHVLDWVEFRALQISFLHASVPDGEIPSDHAIFALLWREAARRGIRYIISGMNFVTESISVPGWAYGHSDWRYIKDVHRRFGGAPLDSYPHFDLSYLIWLNIGRRIRTVSILNYVDYNKSQVMRLLEEQLGWKNYGGKHHESIYTRFYQGYILPRKFGIDKRRAHFSDQINAGQMTREVALEELEKPPYPEDLQNKDREYVLKKLGLTIDEFNMIMNKPPVTFRDYKNNYQSVSRLKKIVNNLRRIQIYPK
jgi:N-acetyl sugar amidotransferase